MTQMIEKTKRCPFCYEEIHEEALKCKHCSTLLNERTPRSYSASTSESSDASRGLQKHIEQILNGKYQIMEQLGEGGMGVVYKARQIALNRIVAIKVLSSMLSADASFIKRFQREAQTIARFNHANIVQIFDIEERDSLHLFIMEYVEGYTLDKFLKEKGRLSVHDSVQIISRAARAIEHAHQSNIIHRDIKPSNIMLGYHGQIKVTDFGLAKDTSAIVSKLTDTGTILGTLMYLSPEGCRGEKVDEKSDIYSLGVVLYEMLTGKPPFDSDNTMGLLNSVVYEPPPDARSLNPEIPAMLNDILMRAMAKDKKDRFESVSHFLEAISEFTSLYENKKKMPHRKKRNSKDSVRREIKKVWDLSESECEDDLVLNEIRRARLATWGAYALQISAAIGSMVLLSFVVLHYAQSEKNKHLLAATREGKMETVTRQLDKGANINARDKDGATPLIYASEAGRTDIVGLLLDHGAQLHDRDTKGRSALMYAVSKGHIDSVRFLLEKGADVNMPDIEYWTPLLLATKKGYTEIAELLLHWGSDVNAKTQYGDTALMVAVNLGRTDILKTLLEKGADSNIVTSYGWTPLMRATAKGDADIMQLLEAAGTKE